MNNQLKIAKAGINVLTATDPNDFIFHSDYNTFKIIYTGVYTPTITASSTETKALAHGLEHPSVGHAFAKPDGYSIAILPNEKFKYVVTDIISFNYIQVDDTNIIFNLTNHTGSDIDVAIKYFLFEVPL